MTALTVRAVGTVTVVCSVTGCRPVGPSYSPAPSRPRIAVSISAARSGKTYPAAMRSSAASTICAFPVAGVRCIPFPLLTV
ncbi:hypothetical protein GCM10010211_70000 [Streptomyces albospinus]|uniref:Lipoprotein n=1 Tax=Streptomyces albospinus TaxID=285515 RepID=A0ABQ2VKW8_9ACTN|nr:hypothetical protein GCM10010211_70000 [Streptomyces albospinus]